MLNVFIIPRGLPERKKNFWPGGAELADLIKKLNMEFSALKP